MPAVRFARILTWKRTRSPSRRARFPYLFLLLIEVNFRLLYNIHKRRSRVGESSGFRINKVPIPPSSPFPPPASDPIREGAGGGGGSPRVICCRRRRMPRGKLEVLLVGAKGLENTDFLSNMDPYAILKCRTQEQRSSIASGKGSDPEWNESFIFTISDGVTDLTIKLMDSDNFTEDDFVGEVTIPLEPLFMEGSLPPAVYNVVKEEEYRGEIKVGLTFKPEEYGSRSYEAENYGGWKESS